MEGRGPSGRRWGGQGKSCLTVTIVGVHVEVWNLPAVDAGICPTTVTVFTVAAHGYCQHGAPGGYKVGGNETLNARPAQDLAVLSLPALFRGGQRNPALGVFCCATWASCPSSAFPHPMSVSSSKGCAGSQLGGTAEHPGTRPSCCPAACHHPPCLWRSLPPYL